MATDEPLQQSGGEGHLYGGIPLRALIQSHLPLAVSATVVIGTMLRLVAVSGSPETARDLLRLSGPGHVILGSVVTLAPFVPFVVGEIVLTKSVRRAGGAALLGILVGVTYVAMAALLLPMTIGVMVVVFAVLLMAIDLMAPRRATQMSQELADIQQSSVTMQSDIIDRITELEVRQVNGEDVAQMLESYRADLTESFTVSERVRTMNEELRAFVRAPLVVRAIRTSDFRFAIGAVVSLMALIALVTEPWLPTEIVTRTDGSLVVGQVLDSDDGGFLAVLDDETRTVQRIPLAEVLARSGCERYSDPPALVRLGLMQISELPDCPDV